MLTIALIAVIIGLLVHMFGSSNKKQTILVLHDRNKKDGQKAANILLQKNILVVHIESREMIKIRKRFGS